MVISEVDEVLGSKGSFMDKLSKQSYESFLINFIILIYRERIYELISNQPHNPLPQYPRQKEFKIRKPGISTTTQWEWNITSIVLGTSEISYLP